MWQLNDDRVCVTPENRSHATDWTFLRKNVDSSVTSNCKVISSVGSVGLTISGSLKITVRPFNKFEQAFFFCIVIFSKQTFFYDISSSNCTMLLEVVSISRMKAAQATS